MAVMDPTRTVPNGSQYAWQGPQVPSSSTTVVADAVPSTSVTVAYHRDLALAFAQRQKAPDDQPLDFDPDELL